MTAGHLGRGGLNRLHNVLVTGAAAEIAGDAVPDLLLRRVRVLLEEAVGAGDHPGRAEAALQAMMLAKGVLQRMQRAVRLRHALDRKDFGAVRLHGKHRARLHRLAVEIDRAGAAMGRLAADVRAGQLELFAQEMDQKRARLDQRLDRLAVHFE